MTRMVSVTSETDAKRHSNIVRVREYRCTPSTNSLDGISSAPAQIVLRSDQDEIGSFVFGQTMAGLAGSFGGLGRAAFRAGMRHQNDEEWAKRVSEIIARATKEIEELG